MSLRRAILRAVAETVVPETTGLNAAGWKALEQTVASAVSARPAAVQRQLRMFLQVIEWLPVLRYGKPFTGLQHAQRHRFLTALQDSPLLVIRRGLWGLRTLVLMGYYTQPDVYAAIGYRADPRGWKLRR